MNIKEVSITLEQAQEWYSGDNNTLKELALQAFTEEELSPFDFARIKSLEDACIALGISYDDVIDRIAQCEDNQLNAIYVLNLVKKALNKDWKPGFFSGLVYYPILRIYPDEKAKKQATEKCLARGASFAINGKKYTLVVGSVSTYNVGLSNYNHEAGYVIANLGLLGCESEEIAKHISRYFSKEIFEAVYGSYNNYEWI